MLLKILFQGYKDLLYRTFSWKKRKPSLTHIFGMQKEFLDTWSDPKVVNHHQVVFCYFKKAVMGYTSLQTLLKLELSENYVLVFSIVISPFISCARLVTKTKYDMKSSVSILGFWIVMQINIRTYVEKLYGVRFWYFLLSKTFYTRYAYLLFWF